MQRVKFAALRLNELIDERSPIGEAQHFYPNLGPRGTGLVSVYNYSSKKHLQNKDHTWWSATLEGLTGVTWADLHKAHGDGAFKTYPSGVKLYARRRWKVIGKLPDKVGIQLGANKPIGITQEIWDRDWDPHTTSAGLEAPPQPTAMAMPPTPATTTIDQFKSRYREDAACEITVGTPKVHAPKVAAQKKQPADVKYDIGYVANIPAWAGPLDRTAEVADEVAAAYAGGFDAPAEMPHRFAMVVGVNAYRALGHEPASTRNAQDAADKTKQADFPLAVIPFTWGPKWTAKGGTDQLATDLAGLKSAGVAADTIDKEIEHKKSLPYGMFRTTVTASPQTKKAAEDLAATVDSVYVHVGDPDAPSLKVPRETPTAREKGVFTKYDELLAAAKTEHGELPWIFGGGYEFRLKSEGGDLDIGEETTYLASKLDMKVRKLLADLNPRAPYYPEPNLLVRYDKLLTGTGAFKPDLFGTGAGESPKLMEKVLAGVSEGDLAKRAGFDPRAAIATGTGGSGARFKAKPLALDPTTKAQIKGTGIGSLTPAKHKEELTNIVRTAQSHAPPDLWIVKLRAGLGLDQGSTTQKRNNLRAIRKVYADKLDAYTGNDDMVDVLKGMLGTGFHDPAVLGTKRALIEGLVDTTLAAINEHDTLLKQLITATAST